MANTNDVTVVGNTTSAPELRFSATGSALCSFSVACNRRWKDRSETWQEATSFFDIICWQDLAEHVAESFQKGDRIIVTGRLEQRSWENQEGEKRHKVEIVADDIGPSLRYATAEVTRVEREGPKEEARVERREKKVTKKQEAAGDYAWGEEPF